MLSRWCALRVGLSAAVLAFLGGCASLAPSDPFLESGAEPVAECARWYQALDRETESAGVRDAQYARVDGFPYLRVDRLHAALRGRASSSEVALQAFGDALLELDLASRRHEIRNLPRASLEALPGDDGRAGPAAVLRRTTECGRLLRELAFAKPELRSAVLQAARVPDDYSTVARLAGFYALTRHALAGGVDRWESETRAAFAAYRTQPADRKVLRYSAPAHTAHVPPVSRAEVAELLARRDALGRPVLGERDLARLAIAYAPQLEVETTADYDRFGELAWARGRSVPTVDGSRLAVYVHPAYTLYGEGEEAPVLLQLVYTAWFPERPARGAVDILAGALDAVVWRVTLAPDGEPVLYDAMHACGCYHEFFPTPRARRKPAPDPSEEWAFVPASLPRVRDGERPVVRLATGTHAIAAVGVSDEESLVRYELRPYDELRSLERPEGAFRSVFGPDGLIAGTERAERFLLWPAGVRSAGAMRQWGRHATAFVGRRHFDDADLVARRFTLVLQGGAP